MDPGGTKPIAFARAEAGAQLIERIIEKTPGEWARLRSKATGPPADPADFTISRMDLERLAQSANHSYTPPRRRGRVTVEPKECLKAVQTTVNLLLKPHIESLASPISAYETSPAAAAERVLGYRYLGTLDIIKAFRSVRPFLVREGLRAAGIESDLLLGLVMRFSSLPPGGPASSPALELALAHSDHNIGARARDAGVQVVRWSDDYGFARDGHDSVLNVMRYAANRLHGDGLAVRWLKPAIRRRGTGQKFLGYSLEGALTVPGKSRSRFYRRLRRLEKMIDEGGKAEGAGELYNSLRGYAGSYVRPVMPEAGQKMLDQLEEVYATRA